MAALATTSCNNADNELLLNSQPPEYIHCLYLSFLDTSGNDLIKGIGYDWFQPEGDESGEIASREKERGGLVKPDLYTLDVVFPDGIENPWYPKPQPGVILEPRTPYMGVWKRTSDHPPYDPKGYYLTFSTSSYREFVFQQPFAEKITFRVKCPYVFGDDATHDIVTWWVHERQDYALGTKCYRVEFDGKEYTQITYEYGDQMSLATVVLESR